MKADERRTAAELCEYVHCAAWMANSIPRFAERVAPLRDLLEEAYKLSGKRTKKSIPKFRLADLGWTDEHSKAYRGLQEQQINSVRTAHRNLDLALRVLTDASDVH